MALQTSFWPVGDSSLPSIGCVKTAGINFLHTTLNETDQKTRWDIDNKIREIKYTFRVLKTELDLRFIYHKTDEKYLSKWILLESDNWR